MERITEYWYKLIKEINAKTFRERVLILIVGLIVFYFTLNQLFFEPLFKRQKLIQSKMGTQESEFMQILDKISALQTSDKSDPDVMEKQKVAELKKERAKLQADIENAQLSFVPPEKMPLLLKDILDRHKTLYLINLKTLSPEDLEGRENKNADKVAPKSNLSKGEKELQEKARQSLDNDLNKEVQSAQNSAVVTFNQKLDKLAGGKNQAEQQAKDGPPKPRIYKYGLELTIRGKYQEVYNYIKELEDLKWQIGWADLKMTTPNFPEVTVVFAVYTVTLEKTWLKFQKLEELRKEEEIQQKLGSTNQQPNALTLSPKEATSSALPTQEKASSTVPTSQIPVPTQTK